MKENRRKKIKLFILWSSLVLFLFYFFVLYPPFNEYYYETHDQISVERMVEKWGDTPFDAVKFKKGSPQQRAAMAADIVRKQKYFWQPIDVVFRDLGQGDFYTHVKEASEYTLERAGTSWFKSADYYLVFDDVDIEKRVKSVYVVQKCCRSAYATYWHEVGLLQLQ